MVRVKPNKVREQLKDTPEKSNRQIAEGLKVNHHTVSGVREELEGIGEIPQCDRKTKDGRTYPAKRSSVFATDKAQSQRAFAALASLHGESET